MTEEFLYGCGVIPRGANRLVTMSDSTDLNDSESIATSKSVYTTQKKNETDLQSLETQLTNQIDNLDTSLQSKITQLTNTITSLSQQLTALQTAVSNIREGLPIGHIFFSMTVPTGCLVCEGQTVSRSEYPELYSYLNTNELLITDTEWNEIADSTYTYCHKFSTGDGTTTFRLPKFASFIELNSNAEAGTFYSAGLPNIGPVKTGTACDDHNVQNGNSPFYVNGNGYECTDGNNGTYVMWFDASRFNSIYGNSTTVQPEAMVWLACIQAK